MKLEKWKKILSENDLKIGNTIIKCTGEFSLLEARNGVVIETEEKCPNHIMVGENNDLKVTLIYPNMNESIIYDNYIILSIASFDRMLNSDITLIKKERPEDFKSNTKRDVIKQFNNDIEYFNRTFREKLTGTGIKHFNLDGGVTISTHDEGSLFDLTDSEIATRNRTEVVKRIALDHNTISELISSRGLSERFFKEIDESMRKLGCSNYSSERPDGTLGLRKLGDYKLAAELRFYGLI